MGFDLEKVYNEIDKYATKEDRCIACASLIDKLLYIKTTIGYKESANTTLNIITAQLIDDQQKHINGIISLLRCKLKDIINTPEI